MKKAARLVFIPYPGVGHLVSAMEFAKLLINHEDRLWITVLLINLPSHATTAAHTNSLHSERIQIINLPHCPPNSESIPLNTLLQQLKPHVKETLSNLTSDSELPLAAFVVDLFCTTMSDVGKEFGVPTLVFFTSGLAFLGVMLQTHTFLEQNDTEPRELSIPSFINPVPSKALPTVGLNKEWEAVFLGYCRGLKETDGIIVNSFEEIESHAFNSFDGALPVYPVGPILNTHLEVEADSTHIFNWLDHQPPSSVVFLCFGSKGSFGEDQVREIARALEGTGAPFLWSLRKPPPTGSGFRASPSDYSISDLTAILPPGFLDRTAGIGKVIGWAPQAQILAHPATAAFVSHCGWNSTLESIYFGVPIATWPLFAEQQLNAFLLVRELKLAVEIALDYRVDFKLGPNTLLTADKIENGIRSVLVIDEDTRNRIKEMSEKSKKTLLEGGSSYSQLGRLIDYIMN